MSFTPTFPGQNANTGDTRAKYLTLFTGEVLKSFMIANIALSTVRTRTISGGKTAQFIVTGNKYDGASNVHTPGNDITTTALATNEVLITVTDRYYEASFLDDLDIALSQYDVRSELAVSHGNKISNDIDKAIFKGIFASRLVAPKAGQTASGSITVDVSHATTAEAKGDLLVSALFEAQTILKDNSVDTTNATFVTSPRAMYQLVQSSKAVNRDFNDTGANGSIASGTVMKIAGISLKETVNLPAFLADGTTPSKLIGMLYTPEVFGVVKAIDIKSETDRQVQKLGELLVSYYALGMGTLNPSCLVCVFDDVVVP
jgi:hypothetical protein